MKEVDDLDIKAEIDEIAKKIDAIIQNIENLDPNKQESGESQNWPAPGLAKAGSIIPKQADEK